MMARELRMEQLSVVADPWNLKLKPAKLKDDPKLPLEKEREILSIVEQLHAMLRGTFGDALD